MNWGGFAAGLSQGFNNGVSMGKIITDAVKQKKIEDVRAQGIAEAQAARNAAVDSQIQSSDQGQQTSQNPAATLGITGQPSAPQQSTAATANEQRTPPPETPAPANQDNPMSQVDEDRSITRRQLLDEAPKSITPTAQTTDKTNTTGTPAVPDQVAQYAKASPALTSSPAQGGLPYVVNGKSYATREEARAAADKATPDVMTFMSKNLVPKMQQAYLEQGDLEKADAWGKWAENRDNQAAMKEWAGAYRAAQIGNFEKAADHVFELYKRYDDGITPVSKETVKDNAGAVTGFNVRLKRDATGEVYNQFIDKKTLTEMGLAALSPQAMFEAQWKRQGDAERMAGQAAIENAKAVRDFKMDIAKEDRKFGQQKVLKGMDINAQVERDQRQQNNAIELKTIESQLSDANASNKVRREVGAKVSALRDAGYSDEFINGALPAILGVGEFKKATSPEEARRLAFSDRMKNDPMFGRKSAADQAKIIDQDMSIVFHGGKATSTTQTPAAQGLPRAQTTTTSPSGKGIPVFDPATGKIVYR